MGATPPARWHSTQRRLRIGAMSLENVTFCLSLVPPAKRQAAPSAIATAARKCMWLLLGYDTAKNERLRNKLCRSRCFESGVPSDRVEIAILVPDRDLVVDRDRCNQAIDRRANRIAFPAALTIDGRGICEDACRKWIAEAWQREESFFEDTRLREWAESLENLLNHRSAGEDLEHRILVDFGSKIALQKLNPDRRIG